MITIGAVIIARYNSNRLYGKVLRDLHGVPALTHTYQRLRKVLAADQIVLATSTESHDDPIEAYAIANGIHCFRGSLDNVAERFLEAGKSMNWDYSIRVNGDNIFIDLQCFQEMLAMAKTGNYDFLSNVKDRTFPKGMSIEMVRTAFYEAQMEAISKSKSYQEHVTLALYENNWGKVHYFYNTQFESLQGIQLALDTAEDFEHIEQLITLLGDAYPDYTLKDIKEAYEQLAR